MMLLIIVLLYSSTPRRSSSPRQPRHRLTTLSSQHDMWSDSSGRYLKNEYSFSLMPSGVHLAKAGWNISSVPSSAARSISFCGMTKSIVPSEKS